eukprot:scaffold1367_cov56-Cyclotella_meneghiniana.AAC.2
MQEAVDCCVAEGKRQENPKKWRMERSSASVEEDLGNAAGGEGFLDVAAEDAGFEGEGFVNASDGEGFVVASTVEGFEVASFVDEGFVIASVDEGFGRAAASSMEASTAEGGASTVGRCLDSGGLS